MKEYIQWLERMIEQTREDKDIQREHWAFCQSLKKVRELALHQCNVSGSLQDIKDIIEFLQWVFRKIDKGDTPEETVRMLLMNREKIDNIKFDSNDR